MIADRLRAAVLQAALSGRLTAQGSDDGTAAELLEQIDGERAQLVKDGKIKKQKPLDPVSDSERPFELPGSWQWSRVLNLSSTVSMKGRTVRRKETLLQGGIPVVSQSTQQIDGYVTSHEGWQHVTDLPVIVFGDHNRFVKFVDFPFVIGADGTKVLRPEQINSRYFFHLVTWVAGSLRNRGYGRHFSLLRNAPCPVAPLPEQERIVAKLDEILPLIDRLAEFEREREHLDQEFARTIGRAILRAAITGKLTNQRLEDGDSAELLKQIIDERAQLTKEGQLRKQKPFPPITGDELPFAIPDSWAWVRFQDVNRFRMGKTPKRAEPRFWSSSDVPWVAISDMRQGERLVATKESVSAEALSECFGGLSSPAGTLLMSFKLTIGRCSFLGIDAVHNEAIVSILPFKSAGAKFDVYLSHVLPLMTRLGDSKSAIKGRTLNSGSIAKLLIPLPPHSEQARIVAKLDEILPLIDRLAELVASQDDAA